MNNPLFAGFSAAMSRQPDSEAPIPPADDQGNAASDDPPAADHDTESASDPEELEEADTDLTKENVDIDLQSFDLPSFQQVSKEASDLTKLANQYEEESKEVTGADPPKPARLGSFLSVDTKVNPGKSLDSPAHSEGSDDDHRDLLDVSSDVNRLDADVGDMKERVQSLTDGQGIFRGQISSIESRVENLDKKMSEIQKAILELTKSMNSYQTSTAAAIGAISRKHKIMGDKELSALSQSVEPPSVVTHGKSASETPISGPAAGKKIKKIANLDDWGL